MKDWTGNANSAWKTMGATNHAGSEREQDDYYATDPKAIDKLLTVEPLHTRIWECACGGGHLSERLMAKGYKVYSTDIKDRGYKGLLGVRDFLKVTTPPFDGLYDIVTNPPYKYAKEFVLKALELLPNGGKCCMFLKLTFLEGKARYDEIFSKFPPSRLYVCSERVQCAKNGLFDVYKGGALAYGWFIWEKGSHNKTTTIDWI